MAKALITTIKKKSIYKTLNYQIVYLIVTWINSSMLVAFKKKNKIMALFVLTLGIITTIIIVLYDTLHYVHWKDF